MSVNEEFLDKADKILEQERKLKLILSETIVSLRRMDELERKGCRALRSTRRTYKKM